MPPRPPIHKRFPFCVTLSRIPVESVFLRDLDEFETHMVYYVENEAGGLKLLSASAFEKRLGESLFVEQNAD